MNLLISERVRFVHRGINVDMALDYDKGTVSFVEKDGQVKKYFFNERTVDYLGGWYIIFDALQKATAFADMKLRQQATLRENAEVEKIANVLMSLQEVDQAESEPDSDNPSVRQKRNGK